MLQERHFDLVLRHILYIDVVKKNFLAELAGKTQPDEEQTDAPADGEETTDTENQTDGQT